MMHPQAKIGVLAAFTFVVLIGLGLLLFHVDNEARKAYLKLHPPATCKICHCGKELCVKECSEESMCAMRCEGLCQRKAESHGNNGVD